jgi:hypothetical protein
MIEGKGDPLGAGRGTATLRLRTTHESQTPGQVFGTLIWDEDSETYSGEAKRDSGGKIAVEITVRNADETSPREFEAFLSAARKQFQGLLAGNKTLESHAVEAQLAKSLTLVGVELDNGGMAQLRYSVGDIWPKKTISFFIDSSGNIV